MNKKILFVSTDLYGELYGEALAASLGDISGEVKIQFMGGSKNSGLESPSGKSPKSGAGAQRFDCIILTDEPSLNLPFLKKAKANKTTLVYYGGFSDGPPKSKTLKKASGLIDMALAIFPFETAPYKGAGIKSEFVGHPLVDIMESPLSLNEAKAALGYDWTELPLTVIPGDGDEDFFRFIFEGAAEAAAVSTRKVRLIVPDAERYGEGLVNDLIKMSPKRIKVLKGQRHAALRASEAALVAAGPATLEAALAGTHLLTIKKTSRLSHFFTNLRGKDPFISLPNIILNTPLYPELSQKDVTILRITQEISGIIESSTKDELESGLTNIRERLGPPGTVRRAAEAVMKILEGK